MVFRPLVFALCALAAGCPGGDPPPSCTTVDTSCAPLYQPTSFTVVYEMTIKNGCGSNNNSCHSARGASGGLSLADEQTAYDGLLNGRVKPGDAACSEMVVRTTDVGKDYTMPPDSVLSAGARCSLLLWVNNGAPR